MAGTKKEFRTDVVIGGKTNPSLRKATLSVQKAFGDIKKFALGTLGVASVTMALGKLKDTMNECVDKAKDQLEAELKLRNAVSNSAIYRNKDLKTQQRINHELLNEASWIQKIGVIGDEVTIAGQQQLMNYGLNSKQVQKLSATMGDLLVKQKGLKATQEDAVGVAKLMGKVLAGNAGALKKQGILYTKQEEKIFKNGTQAQRYALLVKLLDKNVGGLNRQMAQAPEGKIQQMNNLWGDMQERIGMRLIPYQAKFAEYAIKAMPYVENAVYACLTAFDKLDGVIHGVVNFCGTYGKDILVTFGGVTAGIVTYKTIQLIQWLGDAVLVSSKKGLIATTNFGRLGLMIKGIPALMKSWTASIWANVVANRALKIAMASTGIGLLVVILGEIIVHWKDICIWTQKAIDKTKEFFRAKDKAPSKEAKAELDSMTPLSGGTMPTKQGFALGTNHFVGGTTLVGEHGPEVVNLPRGSEILSNNKSQQAIGGVSCNNTFNIVIKGNADENTVKTAVSSALNDFMAKFNAMQQRQRRLGYAF